MEIYFVNGLKMAESVRERALAKGKTIKLIVNENVEEGKLFVYRVGYSRLREVEDCSF